MKSPRPWPRLRVRVERLQPSNRWDFLSLPPSTPSLPLSHYPSLLTSLSHSLPPFLQEATHNALGRKLPHNEYSTSKLEYGRRQGADRPLKYSALLTPLTCGRCTARTNSWLQSCCATQWCSVMVENCELSRLLVKNV